MTRPTWLRLLRATRECNLAHKRGERRKAAPRRLNLELLEDRTLPSTAVTILGNDLVSASGGSLAADRQALDRLPAHHRRCTSSSTGISIRASVAASMRPTWCRRRGARATLARTEIPDPC